MHISKGSKKYDDDEDQQEDEYSDVIDDERDFGYRLGKQPHNWPLEIPAVDDVWERRTESLSTIAEHSSVDSHFHAS